MHMADDDYEETRFERVARQKAFTMFGELRRLVGTGKVFDMSMGLVVAGCFSNLVRALADHIVAPILAFILPIERDLKNMFIVLQCGSGPLTCFYDNADAASKAGAVILNWGAFLHALLNGFILVLAVYIVAKVYNHAFTEEERVQGVGPATRICPFCTCRISLSAVRCRYCTSSLRGGVPEDDAVEMKKVE
ncbi:unnamed protein product (mitochondrion) [Plasmodiophora brassicae]|uniref:Large-conductance mechanosensitive channel n=1 Tax=Plasmodiophora brassicae TaxID=37360 RepID=A0A0G4INH9_PLABS|nr:hypothetical protein PBRA_005338 [Plasmodiophora brassicae]SPQ95394.1 unnamed protein product [Plasmodiophora brassicae]